MDKKGSVVVEAALVFPLVILSVFSLIYIQIFLFGECRVQSDLHRSLLCESGRITGTYQGEEPEGSFDFQRSWANGFQTLAGTTAIRRQGGALLSSKPDRIMNGYSHLTDEGTAVRIYYATKEGLHKDEAE